MHHMFIRGRMPNHVQAIEATSARCQADALHEIGCFSVGEQQFNSKTRCTDTDAHPSNIAGENILALERPYKTARLHHLCQVHCIVRSLSFVVAYCKECFSGLVNLPLCMVMAGEWTLFRRCFREEVKTRIRFRLGRPPVEHTIHNQVALKCSHPLFLSLFLSIHT